ncbi:VCBS repeat-containing protein [Croceitalea sp. MTPC9]|uniref:VCBS repeat-containing protein n=1 Tax=unclassified Croceitalea TaxID=2632280 RepID=UPI002B36E4B0|nr:VCBS repeat-containing protein [Croceitalea sp. MTPC6]GMN16986.1 VCBS repeat-containing protein [Croceitalea sp. MTPC9]
MKYCVLISVLIVMFGCKDDGELFYNPESEETGILFTNSLESNDQLNILDYLYFYNGGGVAIGDINNDGLQDIFFSGNQVSNKLYLNQGDLNFKDISAQAGIEGNSSWNTGSVMADINGDGLLDIYVCAVVGINGFDGYNELFINNGDNTFTESAGSYGLDFDTFSSNAAFLDYDLDGDLDMYILNHAVHTQESFGKADLRYNRNYQTGDKLMRNDGAKFTDVSEEAGIYGGINAYGLGVSVADFNQDGFPDIYVGNDFHEDDYYYLNNGDGTFTESLREYFGHTTRFSMGSDAADINHDGFPDLISLDMLPEEEKALKSSEGDDNIQVQKLRVERYGYHYQFTRNMLYINQPSGEYLETALMSGVAATDWSWSALFADYNQDGEQDLFVSNGITKRPNNLDFIKFISSEQIQKKINNTKLVDQQAINLMPSGATNNYIFKGSGNLIFKDKSSQWISNDTLVSGASAIGDLDNDGDLDLVTNNINRPATLYINKTGTKANYLKIVFKYNGANPFGIGTKVFSYNKGNLQYKELYSTRGFQSSSEPMLHFGYGNAKNIDSIKVVWPNKTYQVLKDVKSNQKLVIRPENTFPFKYDDLKQLRKPLFKKVESNLGINFIHQEDNYTDFIREKLIPYQVSDRGPGTAVGDLNSDGKEDIFFGGSKYKSSKIYLQKDTLFVAAKIPEIQKDSIKEDVDAAIFDIDNDGKKDIFLASGGADFYGKMKPLLDSYFLQKDSSFTEIKIDGVFENASVVKPFDYDSDGDLDVFLGSNIVSNAFGQLPENILLENDNGSFIKKKDVPFSKSGMVTDALWHDFDSDGITDLILVGEWMQPKFFKNTNGIFSEINVFSEKLSGLWQCIAPFDVDGDGDMDYLLGNWGLNSKFKARSDAPMKMYHSDFDDNGKTETIVVTKKNGKFYPLNGLDELAGQMVFLRKKFTNYNDFAGKGIGELFEKSQLNNASVLEVNELRSGVLKNENGQFKFTAFPQEIQVSPITAMLNHDFDGDGATEILVAGNYFGIKPFHGRFDSFPGAIIKSENNVILGNLLGLDFTQKSARDLNIIHLNGQKYLMVTFNNDKVEIYKLLNKAKQ